MSHEFLDFVEDILDAMDKAEVLVEVLLIASLKKIFAPTLP